MFASCHRFRSLWRSSRSSFRHFRWRTSGPTRGTRNLFVESAEWTRKPSGFQHAWFVYVGTGGPWVDKAGRGKFFRSDPRKRVYMFLDSRNV